MQKPGSLSLTKTQKNPRLWTASLLRGLGWRDQEKSVDFSFENWFCFLGQEAIMKDFSPSVSVWLDTNLNLRLGGAEGRMLFP